MNILEYENTRETKTHGNLNFPFNIYPCSIPLDFSSVPAHWHDDMEIIYIKKGHGIVTVDFVSYSVQAGDIICVSPGQLHEIGQDKAAAMEYENIIFQLSMLMAPGEDLCSQLFLTPLLHNRISLPVHISQTTPYHQSCTLLLNKIDLFSGYGDALSMLGIKGALLEFLHLLLCQCKNVTPHPKTSKSLDTIKLILKHIETHYQDTLSIQDMAALCGFSSSHFMKFFKQHMGQSFLSYLNDYRLTLAGRMLSASSDSILTIAESAGFENLSYFNRIFKRKYHMTPSQYREGGKKLNF